MARSRLTHNDLVGRLAVYDFIRKIPCSVWIKRHYMLKSILSSVLKYAAQVRMRFGAVTGRRYVNNEIQDRIDAITWYHEFDFGSGLVTKNNSANIETHRKFWAHIRSSLDSIDFAGKTVLDIGCWDGYWSFYAEQRGAAHVLAIDDCEQNWAGDAGLRLAKELLHSSIEINTKLPVYELSSLQRKLDVILCLGVYYHLIDPFYAFAQIRHCCHENSIVVFEGDVRSNLGLPPGAGIHYFTLSDGAIARFRPTPAVLSGFLEAAYLKVESETFFYPWNLHSRDPATSSAENQTPPKPEPEPARTQGIMRLIWRRVVPQFAKPVIRKALIRFLLSPAPSLYNRIVLICRPFHGENRCFWYRPPFGLDRYDTRWERVHEPK
jgi:tRNA (mo5U34)-methyltransferase